MAWNTPPRWEHGGVDVSADRMQIYSDDLNYLADKLAGRNVAIAPMGAGGVAGFVHQWRWLHYQTRDGEQGIVKATGQTDVNLDSSDSAMAVYDLADVSWLVQGMAYSVNGCEYAVEAVSA